METLIAVGVVVVLALVVIAKTAIVVPQQNAYVVEYLGKYRKTMQAGFHILIPFVERIAYRHSLKEHAVDIPEQICITRDNVQVGVDGVLYMKVLDAQRASYGIGDFIFAISQLAQTTLRSEIGKIDLDRTFEERGTINASVVMELDKASDPWGVKVLRYEIKNINPPQDVLSAMERCFRHLLLLSGPYLLLTKVLTPSFSDEGTYERKSTVSTCMIRTSPLLTNT